MLRTINFEEVDQKCLLIDVRTKSEYNESTIPGAINMPLFSDEERAMIGTTYKKESKEKAKRIGINIVSQKVLYYYDKIQELKKQKKRIVIFCARGGMRSGALCALFNALDVPVWQLNGGYKEYRQWALRELVEEQKKVRYLVLHGYTGTGKTELLDELKRRGANVLDLEKASNHRGSHFGSIGLGKQHNQKQFEGLIVAQLKERNNDDVFVEAESRKIGHNCLSEGLYQRMQEGVHILAVSSIEKRAERLVKEYMRTSQDKTEVYFLLDKLKERLGTEKVHSMQHCLMENDYHTIASILIRDYYDPLYEHKQKTYSYAFTVNTDDIPLAAEQLLAWLSSEKEIEK